jgi:hypothetical protein
LGHQTAAQASAEARLRAAAVLEVLAGVRTPAAAAHALGVSVPRYYLLEQRALQGLVAACERRSPRGRQRSPEGRLAALERELERVKRDCERYQSLARAAQRTLGLAPPPAARTAAPQAGRKRRRKPTIRALRMVHSLKRADSSGAVPEDGLQPRVTS